MYLHDKVRCHRETAIHEVRRARCTAVRLDAGADGPWNRRRQRVRMRRFYREHCKVRVRRDKQLRWPKVKMYRDVKIGEKSTSPL
jgi:hypothetical protein